MNTEDEDIKDPLPPTMQRVAHRALVMAVVSCRGYIEGNPAQTSNAEKSRAEYPTVESLVALMLAYEAPLGGIEVNRQTEVTDEGVLLNVTMAGPQGTSKQTDFLFVRGSNGWQFVVTPDLASHVARKLTQPLVDPGESK